MSTSVISHSLPSSPLRLDKATSGLFGLIAAFRAARAASAAYERLSALSDTALARQGLKRSDLPRVVMTRYFG